MYHKTRETDRPLQHGKGKSVNRSSFDWRKALTTAARVQFTVGTKLDAVDRAVMALQDITFLPIDRVHADPFIC